MILSHKYKYIFIKSFKTASTSLEIALSKFCGTKDIITPIIDEDEKIRKANGFNGPQNLDNNNVFHEHMSASEVKSNVSKEIWNNYFKFVVVRNPFDQIIIRKNPNFYVQQYQLSICLPKYLGSYYYFQ